MKIIVLQENLKTALTYLQKAVPTKPQLPILSSVLLQAQDTTVTLSATDLYFGVKCVAPAKIKTPGFTAVPGEIFKQLISALGPGEIELNLTETQLVITSDKTTSKIPIQNGNEFPQFPEVVGEEVNFSLEEINTIDRNVAFSISLDQTRPILTSLLLAFSPEGLQVVGTDGFRLALLKKPEFISQSTWNMLIPAKAFTEMVRIANQLKVEKVLFSVSKELKQAKIQIANTELYIRLIEGEFPPYQKIIPTTFAQEITFEAEDMITQLKRAAFFAKDTSNIITLSLREKEIAISAKSPAYGEFLGSLGFSGKISNPLEIAFNIHYVLDFLTNTKAEQVILSVNEELRPAQLSIPGVPTYLYIIMPFRTTQTA